MRKNGRRAPKTNLRASLAALAAESLPCLDIAPRTADPVEGLTTMLSIDARNRPDVLDLDRAFFMDNGGTADVSWLSIPPTEPDEPFRLLLSVSVTTPLQCRFVVGISVEAEDLTVRRQLLYLLAADRLALGFGVPVTAESAIIVAAPTDRRALSAALGDAG